MPLSRGRIPEQRPAIPGAPPRYRQKIKTLMSQNRAHHIADLHNNGRLAEHRTIAQAANGYSQLIKKELMAHPSDAVNIAAGYTHDEVREAARRAQQRLADEGDGSSSEGIPPDSVAACLNMAPRGPRRAAADRRPPSRGASYPTASPLYDDDEHDPLTSMTLERLQAQLDEEAQLRKQTQKELHEMQCMLENATRQRGDVAVNATADDEPPSTTERLPPPRPTPPAAAGGHTPMQVPPRPASGAAVAPYAAPFMSPRPPASSGATQFTELHRAARREREAAERADLLARREITNALKLAQCPRAPPPGAAIPRRPLQKLESDMPRERDAAAALSNLKSAAPSTRAEARGAAAALSLAGGRRPLSGSARIAAPLSLPGMGIGFR